MFADYISQIEIDALWGKRKHILWQLDRHVNILSGINGIGKSTILRKTLDNGDGVTLTLMPEEATELRYDVIEKYTLDPDTKLEELEQRFMEYPAESKAKVFDIIDNLYGTTGKKVLRDKEGIRLEQEGDVLTFRELSSGEKQMMLILLTVFMEEGKPYTLFMDEPEVSLHVDWQQHLIETILLLNPNIQIILTTHSPAVIMDGWLDKVTEVSEITV